MRWLLVLVILGGCRSIFGIGTPGLATGDGGGGDDVITDADDAHTPDTPDSAYPCYGSGLFSYCTNVTGAVNYTADTTINTTSSPECATDVANLCVIAAGELTVNANVVAIGTRPLVFVATGTLTIDGTIDASSTVVRSGAGSNPTACTGATAGAGDSGGGGGGAGGSFRSKGANGGTGDTNNSANPVGTALEGMTGPMVVSLTAVRGGCSGTAGGSNSVAGGAGGGSIPGEGGGAIYLIAGTQILVTGKVYASGGGGRTSTSLETGGGGGGAGGMVGFDAPTVTLNNMAVVAANGGGGGGGVGTSTSGATAGNDGTTMMPTSAANGGNGGGGAGVGGRGSCENMPANVGADSDGGGGGGGGGLGVVYVHGAFTSGAAKISPAPELH